MLAATIAPAFSAGVEKRMFKISCKESCCVILSIRISRPRQPHYVP